MGRQVEEPQQGRELGMLGQGHDLVRLVHTGKVRQPSRVRILDWPEVGDVAAALLLGVGMDAATALAALPALAEAGAVGLVVRESSVTDDLVAVAESADLLLLAIRHGMSWDDAFRLLQSGVSAAQADPLAELLHHATGLVQLARVLGRQTARAVTIEDVHGDVVAYSAQGEHVDPARQATILQGTSPPEALHKLRRDGVFAEIDRSEEPVWVSDASVGITGRFGMRVVDGGRVLGYIWVVDEDRSLDAAGLRLVRQAARLASFYMVRDTLELDLERRMRDEVVRDIVGREVAPALIAARARSVGIDAHRAYEVVVVDVCRPTGTAVADDVDSELDDTALSLPRTAAIVSREAQRLDPESVCVVIAESVVVLLPRKSQPRAEALADAVLAATSASGPGAAVSVGIGLPVDDLSLAADAYDQASEASRVAQQVSGGGRVLHYGSLGAYVLLGAHMPQGLPPLSLAVQHLVAYDAQHGTDYATTLDVFLDCFGNRTLAAKRLFVHLNTLVYRLKRLEELAPIDLNDAEARLAAQLEFRRLRLVDRS